MARKKKLKLKIKPETLHSIVAVVLISLGILSIVSLSDKGIVLQYINAFLRSNFGFGALIIPFIFIQAGLVMFKTKWPWSKPEILMGALLVFLGVMVLFRQGEIGANIFANVAMLISAPGAVVLASTIAVCGLLLVTQMSWRDLLESISEKMPTPNFEPPEEEEFSTEPDESESKRSWLPKLGFGKKQEDEGFSVNDNVSAALEPASQTTEDTTAVEAGPGPAPDSDTPIMAKQDQNSPADSTDPDQKPVVWDYPPLSLLSSKTGGQADRGDVKSNADTIEHTLDSFGIKAKVVEVNYGPSVTQYALEITRGTKLSKITNLSTDLALALAAPTGQIRVEAPIPGRSLVGIEVPNYSAQYVTLRTMLAADELKKHPSKLAVALGIDVAGKHSVVDIAKMPHVLIAGATGSGKSVCVNTFLSSILFRATPDEVKFILVDPKRVELTGYNDIPHLLTPVIVDPPKVVSALKWATAEMDRRYKQLAEVGVKNIDSYNELAGFAAMPSIVIVIDELADIMLFAPKEVEDSITRIAQMARAVGIHLVLATQRPSVDVITGLIKANVPTRIAFSVSSQTDSRVILDGPGAEKLLGRGDMLYIPPTQAKPVRIQGTYVSDGETKNLIDFIKSQGKPPEYEEDITTKYKANLVGGAVAGPGAAVGDDGRDELFTEAVKLIARADKASSSMLQRKLRVGYARAARILDELYEAGLVSPPEGSKPREVNNTAVADYIAKVSAAG